jgi:hypothetical protein
MRFQCSDNYGGSQACSRPALTGEEYCRWHLNIRNLQKEAGVWGWFLAVIFVSIGIGCGVGAIIYLWSFVRTPTPELLLDIVVTILWCVFLLSYALILLDKRYALCDKLLTGAMGGIGCIFLLLGCAELIGSYLGIQSIVSVEYLREMPRMLRILTEFGMGIYILLACLNHCFGLQITRRMQNIALTVYILASICGMVFNKAPGVCIMMLLLLISFYLDRRYQWIKKLFGF